MIRFLSRGLAALAILLPSVVHAEWVFNADLGMVYNIPSHLSIKQSAFPTITKTARYETNPFEAPQYYVLRAAKWEGARGFEVEFIHHKLFLKNKGANIQSFSFSHGYNLVYVSYARQLETLIMHLGLGAVITHPESTVNGLKFSEKSGIFNEGYYISGVTGQVALEQRYPFMQRFFMTVEGKATLSYATAKVATGHADVPNYALHLDFGLGANV